jgi:hypothetical protein
MPERVFEVAGTESNRRHADSVRHRVERESPPVAAQERERTPAEIAPACSFSK